MANETKRLTPEAEREIAGRVNPQYSDTPGTESNERALLLSEIRHLRQERDAMAGDLAIALRKLAEIEAQEPVPNDDIPFLDCPLYARPVPAQAVPEGWKLVPAEATEDMVLAGYDTHDTSPAGSIAHKSQQHRRPHDDHDRRNHGRRVPLAVRSLCV